MTPDWWLTTFLIWSIAVLLSIIVIYARKIWHRDVNASLIAPLVTIILLALAATVWNVLRARNDTSVVNVRRVKRSLDSDQ